MIRETMNSRQRVINAIEHKPVDRMPIDLGVHFSTGISAFAYRNLRRYLGFPVNKIEIVDPHQFLARVDEDILKHFHCDCAILHPGFKTKNRWNPREDYEFIIPGTMNPVLQADGSWLVTNGEPGVSLKMPSGGFFFDGVGYNFFEEAEDENIARYAAEAERMFKETDFFTIYVGYGGFIGDFDFMCDMLTDPEKVIECNENMLKWQIEHVSKLIDKMGGYIQGISVGGDLGTQVAPLINPSVYEELSFPYLKRFCSFVHENSDFKIFMHSCGAVRTFIPFFIDAGIDALNPVQISAAEMEPEGLKKDFGDKIAFWGGGCDTQRILNFGTSQDVIENVKHLVNIFKQDSGFIFNQVHNIMGDVKPENIVAMLKTAYENSFTQDF